VARELVPVVHVRRVDLEEPLALRLHCGSRPAGHHGIEERGADAVRDDGDELDQPALGIVEPRRAAHDGVGDRRRRIPVRARGEKLCDVERVAAAEREDEPGDVAGDRGDRLGREGGELERLRVATADRADRRAQQMTGRRLAAPEREDEERGQRADATPDDGDGVERRVVGPVDVLDHEHGGLRARLELGKEQRLDVVRRRTGPERIVERRRGAAGKVAKGTERPRDRKVVARADENTRVVGEIADEALDERGLADAGLPRDENDAAGAGRCGGACRGKRREGLFALQELHGCTIERWP
jgi:hypothetical protein